MAKKIQPDVDKMNLDVKKLQTWSNEIHTRFCTNIISAGRQYETLRKEIIKYGTIGIYHKNVCIYQTRGRTNDVVFFNISKADSCYKQEKIDGNPLGKNSDYRWKGFYMNTEYS